MSPLDSVTVKKTEASSNKNSLTLTAREDIMTSARGAIVKTGESEEHAFVVTLKKLKKTYIFVADE